MPRQTADYVGWLVGAGSAQRCAGSLLDGASACCYSASDRLVAAPSMTRSRKALTQLTRTARRADEAQRVAVGLAPRWLPAPLARCWTSACPTRLDWAFQWSPAGRFLARGSLGVVRAGSSATLAWPSAGFVLARRPLDRSPVQRRPAGCRTWLGLVGQTARGGMPAGRPAGSWLTVRWSGAARALGARPIVEKPDAVGRCRRAAGLG